MFTYTVEHLAYTPEQEPELNSYELNNIHNSWSDLTYGDLERTLRQIEGRDDAYFRITNWDGKIVKVTSFKEFEMLVYNGAFR